MHDIDPTTWMRVSPLLDQLLDLEPADHGPFLARVRAERPDMADVLSDLLTAHEAAVAARFLDAQPLAPQAGLAGTPVGAYVLERPLGSGGMGTVWLARRADGRFEGRAAVKFVNLAVLDRAGQTRFRREGTALARLSHPNIARLLDAGVTPAGQPYLVIDYVEGVRIDQYAAEHRLDVPARLDLFLQIADAVAHAHASLVVHRDLKPSNILVDAGGQVKLLDFGIAKLLADDESEEPLTGRVTGRLFTPEFAAPEQVAGGDITTATDVYALGVLLYHLLVGRHPTTSPEAPALVMVRALSEVEPRLASAAAASLAGADADNARALAERRTTAHRLTKLLRGDLDTVLSKALAKAPETRYQTVMAFADDIRRHLASEPIHARPERWLYRTQKFIRRHRLELTAAAAVVLTLIGATAYSIRQASIANREATRAVAIKDFLLGIFRQPRVKAEGQNLRVIQVIDEGREQLVTSLASQPEVQLEVITVLGDIYELLDATDKAAALFESGLPIAERAFGHANSYAPYLLGAMANSAVFAGDLRRAEAILPRAEAALEAIGDRDSRMFAKILKIKGQVLRTHGPDGQRQAVHVFQQAADLFSRRYPDDQSHVGSYMFLAQAHMALEEPHEALEAAESAVNATAFLPKEVESERASAYSLRASVLDRLGDVDRAEHDYAQASSLYLAAVGAHHFLYLTNENLRGVALHRLGRRDEGLHVVETSAAELSRVRPHSPSEDMGFLRLAGVYERDGQLDRALATIEHAFALLQTTQPPPATISNTLAQTARLRMLMGDLDAATRLVDEAVERAKNANALTAQVEADASIVRGDIAVVRGDRDGALALARRAQSLSGGDTFAARLRLAGATLLESRASSSARALELAASALSIIESLPPPGDALLHADALANYGSLMCASGRMEDARAALKKSLTLRQRFEHPQSPRTAAAQQALSSCR